MDFLDIFFMGEMDRFCAEESLKMANSNVIHQQRDQLQGLVKAMESDFCGSLLGGYEEDKVPYVKSGEKQLTGVKMEKTKEGVEGVWVDCKEHNGTDVVRK